MSKSTRFSFYTANMEQLAQLLADKHFVQVAYYNDPLSPGYTGIVRLTAANKCLPSTIKMKYPDAVWTLPRLYMEFDWLVQQMKEDHPETQTRGRISTRTWSVEQRQRSSASVTLFWNTMKTKVEAGELEWVQKTYPKFWETRQDYIEKYKPI